MEKQLLYTQVDKWYLKHIVPHFIYKNVKFTVNPLILIFLILIFLNIKMQFYSQKHNIIFYHCTKNAMSTLTRELNTKLVEYSSDNLKTIAVIRDPISRLISGYSQIRKLKYNTIYRTKKIPNNELNKIFVQDIVKGFEEYIKLLIQYGPFDTHNESQYSFYEKCHFKLADGRMSNNFYNRRIDKITHFIRFEHLQKDFKDKLDIDIKRTINRSSFSIEDKIKCKNIVLKYMKNIKNIYAKDFELYNKINKK